MLWGNKRGMLENIHSFVFFAAYLVMQLGSYDIFYLTLCRKERTGVDRYSLKQAVIFICATNRPDELDPEFVRYGRIDRRVYVGLPDAKQRVQIFGVHSRGMQFAEDVDFGKVIDVLSLLISNFSQKNYCI